MSNKCLLTNLTSSSVTGTCSHASPTGIGKWKQFFCIYRTEFVNSSFKKVHVKVTWFGVTKIQVLYTLYSNWGGGFKCKQSFSFWDFVNKCCSSFWVKYDILRKWKKNYSFQIKFEFTIYISFLRIWWRIWKVLYNLKPLQIRCTAL